MGSYPNKTLLETICFAWLRWALKFVPTLRRINCGQFVPLAKLFTLPKFNIAPENRPSRRKLVFQPSFFRGYIKLREGNMTKKNLLLARKSHCTSCLSSLLFRPVPKLRDSSWISAVGLEFLRQIHSHKFWS